MARRAQSLFISIRQLPTPAPLGLLLVLAAAAARAQAPTWSAIVVGSPTQPSDISLTRAMAVDAAGNVFVTGSFRGQVAFGATVLTSAGEAGKYYDWFVAKWVPATGTWAWAQKAGGIATDQGIGIAVSGSNVYVTGFINNTLANDNAVVFGGTDTTPGTITQTGTSNVPVTTNDINFNTTLGLDLVVAKYIDQGTSATVAWTQVGGGASQDQGRGIAVSGTSVYVTGMITNNLNNDRAVVFGGTGTTPGTITQNGTSSLNGSNNANIPADLVVAKYIDQGASATVAWTQVGGGTGPDEGFGIAVSGASVYVTGYITNNLADEKAVLFGGTGATPGTANQKGASSTSSPDHLIAKYTDNGTSATLKWTQVGGGTGNDLSFGIAVSGTSVYTTGYINNTLANDNAVVFGGTGITPGTATQPGASSTLSNDLLVAKYIDQGASAALDWTKAGGGTGWDEGGGIAVSGTNVYVAGRAVPAATFDSFPISSPAGAPVHFLGQLVDPTTPLPVELAAFSATAPTSEAVRLAWTTASEKNSAHFTVERSTDGTRFAALGTVPAAGTSAAPHYYAWLDAQLPAGTAALYYRLRQVDGDGRARYSPVRVVATPTPGAGRPLVAYPNPAHGWVRVLVPAAAPAALQLFDPQGRLVHTQLAAAPGAATETQLLLTGLPTGLYLLRSGSRSLRLAVE